jgi:hypoxanthine-guanine phosphoribosyltransferase
MCLCFFGVMLWRPSWSSGIAAAESLLTLSALIISTAARVMIVSDEVIEEGRGFVTINELLNFAIAGTISYVSLMRGVLRDERHFP